MAVESDHRLWVRKLDGDMHIVATQPTQRLYPKGLEEIVECVQTAINPPLGGIPEARAIGSHWGISHTGVTNGYMIETARPVHEPNSDQNKPRLNQLLHNVVPACLSAEAERFFIAQHVPTFNPAITPSHTELYLFHVEAGTRIHELYSAMDAGDVGKNLGSLGDVVKEKGSNADYAGPWALQTMGGAGGQTIAGAFSTGTHGGDVQFGPLADSVIAIHLVDAQGRQHWIERTRLRPSMAPLQLIDEAKLSAVFPKIQYHPDDDLLNAAVIACGRMGIIYSVVLRAVRQFALEETTYVEDWASVKTWLNGSPIFLLNRFVQIDINPYGTFAKPSDRDCYVITRQLRRLDAAGVGDPLGRKERAGLNAGKRSSLGTGVGVFSNPCASDNFVRDALNEYKELMKDLRSTAIKTWLFCAAVIAFPLTPPPVRTAAAWAQAAAGQTIAMTTGQIALIDFLIDSILPDSKRFGDALAALVNFLAQNQLFSVLRFIFGKIYDSQHAYDPSQPRTPAISYAAMDSHDYLNVGCVAPGDSIEIFFDATDPKLIDFIDLVLVRLRQLENGNLQGADEEAFGGYISLRFMSQSQAPLAMQQWPRTCSIEIAGLSRVNGTAPFLTRIEADAIDYNAILHWGQRNNWQMKHVESIYFPTGPNGQLFKWRDALSRLTEHGRFDVFSTAFSKQVGLEITTPIIEQFSATPTEACAGEPVVVSWEAMRNPPETKASLSILPENDDPHTISLSALSGTQSVALGAGRSKVRLTLTRTLADVYEDHREIDVRRFSDGDTWTFTFISEPRSIDGVIRWVAELNLFSQSISNNLRVTQVRITFDGIASWTLRHSDGIDVPFTNAAETQPVPSAPIFNKNWLVFSDTPAGGGSGPIVQLVFTMTCHQ
jgi:hypothetical protein